MADKEKGMWLAKVTMQTQDDKLAVDYDHDMSNAMYIQGDEVHSLGVLSDTRLIVQLYRTE